MIEGETVREAGLEEGLEEGLEGLREDVRETARDGCLDAERGFGLIGKLPGGANKIADNECVG